MSGVGPVPIYLHYLDRELSTSVGFKLVPGQASAVASTLLLATDSQLYAGLSLLFENDRLDSYDRDFLAGLLEAGDLECVSNQTTIDEFLEARRTLYQHDAERYPVYFGKEADSAAANGLRPTVIKRHDTTRKLVGDLLAWTVGGLEKDPDSAGATGDAAVSTVQVGLQRRENRAVTYALFAPYLESGPVRVHTAARIRRLISRQYTQDYLSVLDGDVATGIRGLEYFDILSRNFPFYDVPLLQILLPTWRNWVTPTVGTNRQASMMMSGVRSSEEHRFLTAEIRWLLAGLHNRFVHTVNNQAALRAIVRGTLSRAVARPTKLAEPLGIAVADNLSLSRSHLRSVASSLSRDVDIAEELERMQNLSTPASADVLVVTATQAETDALLDRLTAHGYATFVNVFAGVSSCMFFPSVFGTSVAVVQARMGSFGAGGSALTVSEAIRIVHPRSVIMVGIAFGVDPSKQKIGQVLVAERIQDYEASRVGTDPAGGVRIVARGAKPDASPRLIDRFQAARLHRKGLAISFGLVLSGDKLIDNVDFRDGIMSIAPEALGGEMEGRGLYAAAHRAGVDWLLVKAICDWADGRKAVDKMKRQKVAASNAAEALLLVIREGGLI